MGTFQAELEQKEQTHRAEMAQKEATAAARNNEDQMAAAVQVEKQKKLDDLQMAMLTTLHQQVGLDVTQYMVAQSESTNHKVKFVSSAPGKSPDVHLHSKL